VIARGRVLVVDDESEVREVIQEYLESHDYAVVSAESAAVARARITEQAVDLALIDISMPGEDGLSLARHLRDRHPAIAVMMVTSADSLIDRVVGLEMGADDYLPKPFDPRELVARIKSVLRRTSRAAERAGASATAEAMHGAGNGTAHDIAGGVATVSPGGSPGRTPGWAGEPHPERVRVGKCLLDLASHRMTDQDGMEVPLTPLEFDLLKALTRHPNRVLSRDSILNLSQQRGWDPFDRSVDLRVMRVRKKIEPDPERPRFIRTVRNAGYLFVPSGE
jgi:DNA-binding response OmpR family regulator